MPHKQKLMEYFHRGSSSILDTLSDKKHSPDFAYARNHYLGSRLRIVCWIFILLSPFWALFDHLLLPAEPLPELRLARLFFFAIGRASCREGVLVWVSVDAGIPTDGRESG